MAYHMNFVNMFNKVATKSDHREFCVECMSKEYHIPVLAVGACTFCHQ